MRTLRPICNLKTPGGADVQSMEWHPEEASLFVTGDSRGGIAFWDLNETQQPVTSLVGAHDQVVNSLSWHPLGHIVASGSGDMSVKFWARLQPGMEGGPVVDCARFGSVNQQVPAGQGKATGVGAAARTLGKDDLSEQKPKVVDVESITALCNGIFCV